MEQNGKALCGTVQSLVPSGAPDTVLIEKMKDWADFSKDVVGTLFSAAIAKAEEGVIDPRLKP